MHSHTSEITTYHDRPVSTNIFRPETSNTRQNGYQTVPFGVYIHNLMFVFLFDQVF